jgi:hypothetical protein
MSYQVEPEHGAGIIDQFLGRRVPVIKVLANTRFESALSVKYKGNFSH